MAEQKKRGESKEAFVGAEDRPEVTIDPDRPITELKVRDLSAILGHVVFKKPEFKDWIKEKPEFKEFHKDKLEKFEKPEKFEKLEKFEKPEFKEFKEKPEKLELEPQKRVGDQFEIPDPRVIEQITEMFRNLSRQVDKLANQVAALEQKLG